jgi:hypothetical protein
LEKISGLEGEWAKIKLSWGFGRIFADKERDPLKPPTE